MPPKFCPVRLKVEERELREVKPVSVLEEIR
jgi:hypothetical protein